MERQAVSVITQVVVDKEDKAFETPVKPIGMFYTKQDADRMEKEQGFVFTEDAGRGYRRVCLLYTSGRFERVRFMLRNYGRGRPYDAHSRAARICTKTSD